MTAAAFRGTNTFGGEPVVSTKLRVTVDLEAFLVADPYANELNITGLAWAIRNALESHIGYGKDAEDGDCLLINVSDAGADHRPFPLYNHDHGVQITQLPGDVQITDSDLAMYVAKRALPDLRPPLDMCRADVTLDSNRTAESRIAWWDSGREETREGTLRGGVWTAEGQPADGDPRDHHVRVTLTSGLDVYVEWETLAVALMHHEASIRTR